MIQWTQQHSLITNIFYSFQNGKKVQMPLDKRIKTDRFYLRPEKFELQTLSNFKIILISEMFKFGFSSKIDFLKHLNSMDKKAIQGTGKLRSDILSYDFLIKKDFKTLETLNISPYEAYTRKMIHAFSVGKYYFEHPTEVKGRIMSKNVKDMIVMLSFFKKV